jgi:hypothetical protein
MLKKIFSEKKRYSELPEIKKRKILCGQEWWHMPIIPALCRWRQEDCEFEVNIGDIVRSFLKKTNSSNNNNNDNNKMLLVSRDLPILYISHEYNNKIWSFVINFLHLAKYFQGLSKM